MFRRPDRRPVVFDFGMFSSLCTGLGGSMLFCGGTSSRLSSVVRGLSDAARCLFLLLGLCRGFFVSSASRVARCDAILFRFSGGCPSFFVWWRHACMQNIKNHGKIWIMPFFGSGSSFFPGFLGSIFGPLWCLGRCFVRVSSASILPRFVGQLRRWWF